MSTVAKILVVVNLILAVAFVATAATFLGAEEHWKAQYATNDRVLKATIETHRHEAAKARQDLESVRAEAADAQRLVGEAETAARAFKTQYDHIAQAHRDLSASNARTAAALEEAVKTNKSNRDLIDSLQTERQRLTEARQVALQAKDAAVRTLNDKELQLERVQAEARQLQARVEELSQQVRSTQFEAEALRGRAAGADDVPMDQPSFRDGRILQVDNDAGLAVISFGREDGVRAGHAFTIYRGSQYVGRLVVTDVERKQAAGRIERDLQRGPVQRGDQVMSPR